MADSTNRLEYSVDQWSGALWKAIGKMRQAQLFCDVQIVCSDGASLLAHSLVLAAASPYLKQYMVERGRLTHKQIIQVHVEAISAPTWSALLDFIYTGQVSVSRSDVYALLAAAEKLEIILLREWCRTVVYMDKEAVGSESPHFEESDPEEMDSPATDFESEDKYEADIALSPEHDEEDDESLCDECPLGDVNIKVESQLPADLQQASVANPPHLSPEDLSLKVSKVWSEAERKKSDPNPALRAALKSEKSSVVGNSNKHLRAALESPTVRTDRHQALRGALDTPRPAGDNKALRAALQSAPGPTGEMSLVARKEYSRLSKEIADMLSGKTKAVFAKTLAADGDFHPKTSVPKGSDVRPADVAGSWVNNALTRNAEVSKEPNHEQNTVGSVVVKKENKEDANYTNSNKHEESQVNYRDAYGDSSDDTNSCKSNPEGMLYTNLRHQLNTNAPGRPSPTEGPLNLTHTPNNHTPARSKDDQQPAGHILREILTAESSPASTSDGARDQGQRVTSGGHILRAKKRSIAQFASPESQPISDENLPKRQRLSDVTAPTAPVLKSNRKSKRQRERHLGEDSNLPDQLTVKREKQDVSYDDVYASSKLHSTDVLTTEVRKQDPDSATDTTSPGALLKNLLLGDAPSTTSGAVRENPAEQNVATDFYNSALGSLLTFDLMAKRLKSVDHRSGAPTAHLSQSRSGTDEPDYGAIYCSNGKEQETDIIQHADNSSRLNNNNEQVGSKRSKSMRYIDEIKRAVPTDDQDRTPGAPIHPLTCTVCKKVFSHEYLWRRHMGAQRECDVCGITCHSLHELRKHLKEHEEFICRVCGSEFDTAFAYKRHLATHALMACYMCGAMFEKKSVLERHLQTHETSDNKLMSCYKCGAMFDEKDVLETHLQSHDDSNDKSPDSD